VRALTTAVVIAIPAVRMILRTTRAPLVSLFKALRVDIPSRPFLSHSYWQAHTTVARDALGGVNPSEYTAKFDGKDYPAPADSALDTNSIRRINANTYARGSERALSAPQPRDATTAARNRSSRGQAAACRCEVANRHAARRRVSKSGVQFTAKQ
jgi:hypothetical protein